MVCIYVAIGQKASTVANIRETLAQHGALDYTIIVSATAADSAPMQYIAPMAGAAIGEFFMYNGEDGKPAARQPLVATCSSSTTTCPSRLWLTVRCR